MILVPQRSPESGLASRTTLLLVLLASGGLVGFLFTRDTSSRAAPRGAPRVHVESPQSTPPASDPEPALAVDLVPPGDAEGDPSAAEGAVIASVANAAGSPESAADGVPAAELQAGPSVGPEGPKLKQHRGKGPSDVDMRARRREQRTERKQREEALAQSGAAVGETGTKTRLRTQHARAQGGQKAPPPDKPHKPKE